MTISERKGAIVSRAITYRRIGLPHAGADPLAEKLATKPYQISSTSPIGVAMYRFRAAFENWTGPALQVRLDDRQLRFPGAGG
jgi:hypothetical protein